MVIPAPPTSLSPLLLLGESSKSILSCSLLVNCSQMMGKLPCQQNLGFLVLTHECSEQCENLDAILQAKANLGKYLKKKRS